MSPNPSTPSAPAPEQPISGPVISGDALVQYESMLAGVPDVEAASYDRILEQLAAATSLEDLEAPWRARGGEQYLGQWLIIRGIRKMPSDFRGGLPWFLVVDAALADGGKAVTFTTGSVNVVAQLVKAHALDLFPVEAMLLQADKPTRDGYYPQRLHFRTD